MFVWKRYSSRRHHDAPTLTHKQTRQQHPPSAHASNCDGEIIDPAEYPSRGDDYYGYDDCYVEEGDGTKFLRSAIAFFYEGCIYNSTQIGGAVQDSAIMKSCHPFTACIPFPAVTAKMDTRTIV